MQHRSQFHRLRHRENWNRVYCLGAVRDIRPRCRAPVLQLLGPQRKHGRVSMTAKNRMWSPVNSPSVLNWLVGIHFAPSVIANVTPMAYALHDPSARRPPVMRIRLRVPVIDEAVDAIYDAYSTNLSRSKLELITNKRLTTQISNRPTFRLNVVIQIELIDYKSCWTT